MIKYHNKYLKLYGGGDRKLVDFENKISDLESSINIYMNKDRILYEKWETMLPKTTALLNKLKNIHNNPTEIEALNTIIENIEILKGNSEELKELYWRQGDKFGLIGNKLNSLQSSIKTAPIHINRQADVPSNTELVINVASSKDANSVANYLDKNKNKNIIYYTNKMFDLNPINLGKFLKFEEIKKSIRSIDDPTRWRGMAEDTRIILYFENKMIDCGTSGGLTFMEKIFFNKQT